MAIDPKTGLEATISAPSGSGASYVPPLPVVADVNKTSVGYGTGVYDPVNGATGGFQSPTLTQQGISQGVFSSQFPQLDSYLQTPQQIQDQAARERQIGSDVITGQYAPKIQEAKQLGEQQVSGAEAQLGIDRGLGVSSSRMQFVNNLQQENQKFISSLESERDNAIQNMDFNSMQQVDQRLKDMRDYVFNLQQYKNQQAQAQLSATKPQQVGDKTYQLDPTTGQYKLIDSQGSTTSQKDYQYYVNQTKQNGGTPLSFDQWVANQKAPAAVKEYLAAKEGGFQGSILDYQLQKKGGGATLDPDTIQFMAAQYIASPGSAIPSFGMGAPGMAMRAQFYKAVADQAEAQGLSGQALAARKAGATAAQSALTAMTKQTAFTSTAEKAAIKNLDLAYSLGEQYDRSGQYPAENRFQNWLAQAGFSGQAPQGQYSAFEVALYTGAREYAKVASGAAGSVSGLTDSATKEAENMINTAMTQGQLKSTLDTMKLDMENVNSSQNEQIVSLKDQIETGSSFNETQPSGNTNVDTSSMGW